MTRASSRTCLLLVAVMTATNASWAAGQSGAPTPPPPIPQPVGYLGGTVADIFALPPLPPTINLDIERNQVLSAQLSADRYERDEAFADAEAYPPDNLMTRFSVAAGETMTRSRRPILSHVLYRIWANLDAFSSDLKKLYPRKRPFINDPTIAPCDLSYLQDKTSGDWTSSYPSGHSADGYVVALLLADVMRSGAPGVADRTDALMARGVRFGTNRMVCGVHYPSDVATGEAFAKALYEAIKKRVPQFAPDLACAREEEAADRKGLLGKPTAYSPGCWDKIDEYTREPH
jgi:acid phosphatase (class A)